MYETLIRAHDVSHVPALTPISEISEKLKQAERKREDKRLKQIVTNRASKRKREGGADLQKQEQGHDAEEADEPSGTKRVKTDDEDASITDTHVPDTEPQLMDVEPRGDATAVSISTDPTATILASSASSSSKLSTLGPGRSPIPAKKISVSKAFSEVRGHTSYLTFACLQPFTPAMKSSAKVDTA
jgi:tRNA (adenine57-N1/adenine58-N1)-methyltransferase